MKTKHRKSNLMVSSTNSTGKVDAHLEEEERSQINNLIFHLKELKKEGKAMSDVSREQENKQNRKQTMKKINEAKGFFFKLANT